MTGSLLARLRAAHQAATRVGWQTFPLRPEPTQEIRVPSGDIGLPVAKVWAPEDAELIVQARNALPLLLDLAEAAQELLGDDDMPVHWPDCVCSYCVRYQTLKAALAALNESGQT